MVGAVDSTVLVFPHMDWRFNEFPNEEKLTQKSFFYKMTSFLKSWLN